MMRTFSCEIVEEIIFMLDGKSGTCVNVREQELKWVLYCIDSDTMWPQFLPKMLPEMDWAREAYLCKVPCLNSSQNG